MGARRAIDDDDGTGAHKHTYRFLLLDSFPLVEIVFVFLLPIFPIQAIFRCGKEFIRLGMLGIQQGKD